MSEQNQISLRGICNITPSTAVPVFHVYANHWGLAQPNEVRSGVVSYVSGAGPHYQREKPTHLLSQSAYLDGLPGDIRRSNPIGQPVKSNLSCGWGILLEWHPETGHPKVRFFHGDEWVSKNDLIMLAVVPKWKDVTVPMTEPKTATQVVQERAARGMAIRLGQIFGFPLNAPQGLVDAVIIADGLGQSSGQHAAAALRQIAEPVNPPNDVFPHGAGALRRPGETWEQARQREGKSVHKLSDLPVADEPSSCCTQIVKQEFDPLQTNGGRIATYTQLVDRVRSLWKGVKRLKAQRDEARDYLNLGHGARRNSEQRNLRLIEELHAAQQENRDLKSQRDTAVLGHQQFAPTAQHWEKYAEQLEASVDKLKKEVETHKSARLHFRGERDEVHKELVETVEAKKTMAEFFRANATRLKEKYDAKLKEHVASVMNYKNANEDLNKELGEARVSWHTSRQEVAKLASEVAQLRQHATFMQERVTAVVKERDAAQVELHKSKQHCVYLEAAFEKRGVEIARQRAARIGAEKELEAACDKARQRAETIEKITAAQTAATDKIHRLNTELVEATKAVQEFDKDARYFRGSAAQLTSELQKAAAVNTTLCVERDGFRDQNKNLRRQVNDLQNNARRSAENLVRCDRVINHQRGLIKQLKADKAALSQNWDSAECDHADKEETNDTLVKRNLALEKDIATQGACNENLARCNENQRTSIERLQTALGEARISIRVSEKLLADKNSQILQLQADTKVLVDSVKHHRADAERTLGTLNECRTELADAQIELGQVKTRLEQAEQDLKVCQSFRGDDRKAFAEESLKLQEDIEQLKNKLHAAELRSQPAQHTQELENRVKSLESLLCAEAENREQLQIRNNGLEQMYKASAEVCSERLHEIERLKAASIMRSDTINDYAQEARHGMADVFTNARRAIPADVIPAVDRTVLQANVDACVVLNKFRRQVLNLLVGEPKKD